MGVWRQFGIQPHQLHACLTSDEILLEIIMRRYENRSTIMTSNRPIEELGNLLSDVPAANTTPPL